MGREFHINIHDLAKIKATDNVDFQNQIISLIGDASFIGARGKNKRKDKGYMTKDIGEFEVGENYYMEAITNSHIYAVSFDVTEEEYQVRGCKRIAI